MATVSPAIARRVYKSIAYSFPTSHNAEYFGRGAEGAWHISVTYIGIEGSDACCTFVPHDAEAYDRPDDPDLIAQFREEVGEIDPSFLRYGNPKALAAI